MRCNFLLLIQYEFMQWYYFSPQFSSLALHIPFHTFCCLLYLIFFIFKWSPHSCYFSEDQSNLLPKILVIFQRRAFVWLLLLFSYISLITFARFNVDLKITFSLTAGNFFNPMEPLFARVFSHSIISQLHSVFLLLGLANLVGFSWLQSVLYTQLENRFKCINISPCLSISPTPRL